MNNTLSNMFGRIQSGMARIGFNGEIAIKTPTGYKTYNVDTGTLVNCDDFALDIGQDFFFLFPTNKVQKGDIILNGGKPCCVIEERPNSLKVLRYEDGAIQEVAIEKHLLFGKQYFYSKIVSLFGNIAKNGNMGDMMQYMMLAEMMKGRNGASMDSMLPMMMLMGGGNIFGNLFKGMFDEDKNEDK